MTNGTNSTIISILQDNIKKYRKKAGLTQMKLSILTGVSKEYITSIECKKRTPSLKRLVMIAKTLNVELYKFFLNNEKL